MSFLACEKNLWDTLIHQLFKKINNYQKILFQVISIVMTTFNQEEYRYIRIYKNI